MLYFYATLADHQLVLEELEGRRGVRYVQRGLFTSLPAPNYSSYTEIPDLGLSLTGDSVTDRAFLVVPRAVDVQVRQIELYEGGVRYSVSQLQNPESIVYQPGGVYGTEFVIQGNLSTVSKHPEARDLYQAFAQKTKRTFTRIQSSLVGPEALHRFRSGTRLTSDSRVRFYDLKHEPLQLPSKSTDD